MGALTAVQAADALHSAGQTREAHAALGQALKRMPGDRGLLERKEQLAAC
jgi:hypothetical protein